MNEKAYHCRYKGYLMLVDINYKNSLESFKECLYMNQPQYFVTLFTCSSVHLKDYLNKISHTIAVLRFGHNNYY